MGPDWSVCRGLRGLFSVDFKVYGPTQHICTVSWYMLSLACSLPTCVENETRPCRRLVLPSRQVAGRPFPLHAMFVSPSRVTRLVRVWLSSSLPYYMHRSRFNTNSITVLWY